MSMSNQELKDDLGTLRPRDLVPMAVYLFHYLPSAIENE